MLEGTEYMVQDMTITFITGLLIVLWVILMKRREPE